MLDVVQSASEAVAYSVPSSDMAHLRHRPFFNLAAANMRRVSGLVHGTEWLGEADVEGNIGSLCRPCVYGRMQATPYAQRTTTTSKVELLHIEIVGPLPASPGKAFHFVSILEDSMEPPVAAPLKRIDDAAETVKAWILQLSTQTGLKVQRACRNEAGEYVETTNYFLSSHGIRLQVAAAYAPQQDGKAERLNKTLMELVRAVSSGSGLDHSLRAEALRTEIFSRTRSPGSGANATPLDLFYGEKPNVGVPLGWASPIHAVKPKKQQRKPEPQVLAERLVGYVAGGKTYRVNIPVTKNVVVPRDVLVADGVSNAGRHTGLLVPGFCMPRPQRWAETTEMPILELGPRVTPSCSDDSSTMIPRAQDTAAAPIPSACKGVSLHHRR